MSAPATRLFRSSFVQHRITETFRTSPTHKPKGIQQKSTSMIRRILPRILFFRAIIPRGSRPILPLTSHASTPETRTLTRTLRIAPFRSIHATPAVRLSSSSAPHSPDAKEPGTLTQRLKTLMKAYGWYAVGVYIAISVVDFTVAFAGINLLGAEYVSSVAASAKASLLNMVYSRPPEPGREEIEDASGAAGGAGGQEGLYAMLVLAYTVHKTLFLPVRIGFTAAFTPRLVNWLRARGWVGGEGTRRAMHEMRERLRDRD